jgi:uncharacterized membrane protein
MAIEEPANTIMSAILIGNYALAAAWVVLALVALFKMRRAQISSAVAALWIIAIAFIPVIGALGFILTLPSRKSRAAKQ